MNKVIFALILILSFSACTKKQNEFTVYFFISNGSEKKKTVDLVLEADNRVVFDSIINYSNIQPELRYTPSIKLFKGKYIINVKADSGRVNKRKSILVDSDKWVFVSYGYEAPLDSAERIRTIKMMKDFQMENSDYFKNLLEGSKPDIIIHVMHTQPIHM